MYENICLVKIRLLTSFCVEDFSRTTSCLLHLSPPGQERAHPVPVPTAGSVGGAQPSPHLQNVLHALIDELHVDDVEQGGCWQHLPPETQQPGQAPPAPRGELRVRGVSGAASVRPRGLRAEGGRA